MAKETAVKTVKYSKEQLVRSDRYMRQRDLLGALLRDGERYTLEEVNAKLDNYMKGKVK